MIDYKNVSIKESELSAWDYIGAGAFVLTLILLVII